MIVRVHRDSRSEAIDAIAGYETICEGLGVTFADHFLRSLAQIERNPRLFARLESTRLSGEIRRAKLPRFPYIVIYEVHADFVQILAVAHASREPDYWSRRRDPEDE
ncbi:type II toxin-antitoxin system RelE/ParE family toxin [Lacipirellula limnantheis]|uniref:type II toxin-antitoxin system RelE/ParE family toxin n=1 Tax=Lacipirellula limnantheis TaxID=2528024 RepID=UPI00119CE55C